MHLRALLGQQAEKQVADYLETRGYSILEKNYRISGGEIDVIAESKTHVLFVEVKMRQRLYFDLTQVITTAKQRKIVRTAQLYMARHAQGLHHKIYRFDVALVHDEGSGACIEYIPNAFTTGECGYDNTY